MKLLIIVFRLFKNNSLHLKCINKRLQYALISESDTSVIERLASHPSLFCFLRESSSSSPENLSSLNNSFNIFKFNQ